ncbi:MAG: adenylate/guanylate cyclase domain-containing protein [Acidimicrobiia bacterium]
MAQTSNPFDVAALAERGGVEAGFVERVLRLRIVAPGADGGFSAGDVRRVKLMDTLDRAGVPLDRVATAFGDGVLSLDFLDALVFDRLAPVGETTFAELAEETGVPVDLLMALREVTGSAQPQPDDRVREDEMLAVPFVRFAVGKGVSPRGLERLLRVYGESLRRIAESEADWWHAELMPVLGTDADPARTLDAAAILPPDVTEWSDQAVLAIYHAHQAHTWTKSMIESVEATLEVAGLYNKLEQVPAISFLDITGYTRLTEERGDEAAADLAENLSRMVQRIAVRHGGEPVKRLGDGVMFHFPVPSSGVAASLEMVDGVAEAGLPPAHVGVDAGQVLFQDGDYYGRTVNVASRIADYARPGEVLVSEAVLEVSDRSGIAYAELGPVELKGVSEPTRLWVATRER